MDKEQLSEIMHAQFKICDDVLFDKSDEYASEYDVLTHFRRTGEMRQISMQNALAGMMVKHTISLYDMCAAEAMPKFAKWDEKITDHINYLILLRAIIVEYEEDQENFMNEMSELIKKEHGNAEKDNNI